MFDKKMIREYVKSFNELHNDKPYMLVINSFCEKYERVHLKYVPRDKSSKRFEFNSSEDAERAFETFKYYFKKLGFSCWQMINEDWRVSFGTEEGRRRSADEYVTRCREYREKQIARRKEKREVRRKEKLYVEENS